MRSGDVRDGRELPKAVASMDAERLAAVVQKGELTPEAEKVAMAELAGRVLADEIDYSARGRSRAGRIVDGVTLLVSAAVIAAWVAQMFGVFK